MFPRKVGSAWEIDAPAKLNLYLEILGPPNEGFHPLETLMVTQPGGSTRSLVFKSGEPITLVVLRLDHKKFFHKKACHQNELPEKMKMLFSLSKKVKKGNGKSVQMRPLKCSGDCLLISSIHI